MQINPTGQITSGAQVQAIISGSQTPVQLTADTQVAASAKDATQVAPTDQVTISSQARALAQSENNESSATEGTEPVATQSSESESQKAQAA